MTGKEWIVSGQKKTGELVREAISSSGDVLEKSGLARDEQSSETKRDLTLFGNILMVNQRTPYFPTVT